MSTENQSYDIMDADMSMSTEKAKNSRKTMWRLVKALMPQKWKLLAAIAFAVVSQILFIRTPGVLGNAFDVVFEGILPSVFGFGEIAIDFTRLGELMLLLTGLYAISSLLMYVQERLMADVSQKLVLSLRERIGKKLAHVPLKFYDNHKKGEILSRVTNDLERLNEILSTGIMRLFTSVILIVGVLILMFRINWILTLIAIGSIFIGLIVTAIVSAKSNEYFTARQRSMGIFNVRIEENFSGQVEIKTFNLEQKVAKETDDAIEELRRDDKKAQFIMFAIMPIIRLFNHIGYVVIAAVGASFVITGRISIGQVLAIFQYVQLSAEPMTEGAYILNSFQSAIAAAERVFELLDEEEEVKTDRIPARLQRPHGDISFEHVRFGYGDELLMTDVNFEVKAGQKVAIVGATGAGKTTLVNLIMRFYEVQGGAIKVDGVDVRDFNRKYLRSLFGMVLQDSWIFDGTIADNIAYGRPGAERSEIIDAARAARADYFIRTLPHGYDTKMNDENANLSMGEKQLLCIARAILAKPHFLLLDEATSSVDTRTEVHIQKAMDSLMKGRTSFVIAHRLSTIKNADMILVMSKGDVVEIGNHEELLQRGGMYSGLYNSQFAS